MATVDNPPEGTLPVPQYPNPLANNVNMHRFPAQVGDFPAQDAPVRINGAAGSAFNEGQ